ncbi:hypothetical protein HUK80_13370 [Flavobacterium sp. MAH-1]|uniref:DUF6965 domain-containing protein n=1 Tax=Flavobacterium agri TaxID=2743471 RepID=A0A7Y9C804_9FLAO|nr:hypothetical protein [Flavobacterium agri]NUY81888.1 hypothetical protein [Flavobacterium agri]NYA71912.1 hypothetical protein [Flavobacterium agri]
MDPEEIKLYFEKNPPPPSLDWKPWARIGDTQKFLNSCYKEISNFKGNIENCPGYWRLKEFYLDMIVR